MFAINALFSYRPTAPAVDPAELRATRDHMAAPGAPPATYGYSRGWAQRLATRVAPSSTARFGVD